MCTIDLKNAYYLVPIDSKYKKYLRFEYDSKLFEYNCLPMGLNTSPFVFTKLLKPVVEHLRKQGIRVVIYLDDLICLGSSYKECCNYVQVVYSLLTCLGFIVNTEKSQMTPSTVREYLGYELNSIDMTLSPTGKKRQKILNLVNSFLKINSCSIRDFATLLGNLVSVCMAISYGFVYTKVLEKDKFWALERNGGNYDSYMDISKEAKLDLLWWKENILLKSNNIKQYRFTKEIFSDASMSGWGAFCNGESARGTWDQHEVILHINYLELLAAFFALKCFAKKLRGCEILMRIDNTTAISYINRMGSVQYPLLNSLAKEIWRWCENRELWIFASYIKSRDNVEADFESRISNSDIEWKLDQNIFEKIIESFGVPDIDLFASRLNNKCLKYVAWHRDPFAWNIDAFTIDWNDYFFYAFPPFALILKVLQKIRADKAKGILIFPLWPTEAWYPLIKSLAVSKVLTFGPSKDLLTSPSRTLHPLHQHLTLGACILSGNQ